MGRHQARDAGALLAGEGIGVIVCSPFVRCLQTAREVVRGLGVRGNNLRIHVDYGLSEVLSERNMKGVTPSPLPLGSLEEDVRALIVQPASCLVCRGDGTRTCLACEYGGGVAFPEYPEALRGSAGRYWGAFERVATRYGQATGMSVLCVAHGDTVAQFVGDTREGVSKDDVYETPHCCWAMAFCHAGGGGWRDGADSGNIGVLMSFDD